MATLGIETMQTTIFLSAKLNKDVACKLCIILTIERPQGKLSVDPAHNKLPHLDPHCLQMQLFSFLMLMCLLL